LAIRKARDRIRVEQQSWSKCNRAIALSIHRQRIAAEKAVRLLCNRNIALACFAQREVMPPLLQSPSHILETDSDDIDIWFSN
jgi:hypothetical protein